MICAPSRWLADLIEELYHVDCTVLPNGVDTQTYAPMKNVEKRRNVVLFVGRFVQSKGLGDLLEAAKALPEYEFWLAGKNTGVADTAQLRNVKLLGLVKDVEALVSYYNQATICAFPSYWEVFPMVGLEAMACGKAIIATSLGFSEYLEDGRDGLIIQPNQRQELVKSIKYLMENESVRSSIERSARDKALKFDWNNTIGLYKALYENLQ